MSVAVQLKSLLTAARVIAFGILTEVNTPSVVVDTLVYFFKKMFMNILTVSKNKCEKRQKTDFVPDF